jgi:hypothetical protein
MLLSIATKILLKLVLPWLWLKVKNGFRSSKRSNNEEEILENVEKLPKSSNFHSRVGQRELRGRSRLGAKEEEREEEEKPRKLLACETQ